MAQDLIQSNPFLRAATQLQAKGRIDRPSAVEAPQRSTRARLNFIPDDSTLAAMIDRALEALSKGRFWDRGSILNLTV